MNQMKNLIQQAKKLNDLRDKIGAMTVEGSSGGGLVAVTLNGLKKMDKIQIDPSLLKEEEKEMLEDLIVAASRDAHQKMETLEKEEMQKAMGGLMGGMPFLS